MHQELTIVDSRHDSTNHASMLLANAGHVLNITLRVDDDMAIVVDVADIASVISIMASNGADCASPAYRIVINGDTCVKVR